MGAASRVGLRQVCKFAISVHSWICDYLLTQIRYLLWEPADQLTIAGASLVYTNRNKIHLPGMVVRQLQVYLMWAGLRFAINIDLVQFQLYAANESVTAWNFGMEGGGARCGGVKSPSYQTCLTPRILQSL